MQQDPEAQAIIARRARMAALLERAYDFAMQAEAILKRLPPSQSLDRARLELRDAARRIEGIREEYE